MLIVYKYSSVRNGCGETWLNFSAAFPAKILYCNWYVNYSTKFINSYATIECNRHCLRIFPNTPQFMLPKGAKFCRIILFFFFVSNDKNRDKHILGCHFLCSLPKVHPITMPYLQSSSEKIRLFNAILCVTCIYGVLQNLSSIAILTTTRDQRPISLIIDF